jgi:tetratricopeptide (TPR) repeat protein
MDRESTFAQTLLSHVGIAETLKSIEIAVWLIFGLMLISLVRSFLENRKKAAEEKGKASEWGVIVESAYERGRYDDALRTLETTELLFPKSALVKFWQGRCHFRLENWEKAAEKFQESCRLEPYYRKSVRDYMAFIQLNELVPGVEGYLDR